jgi:inhibitor of cysteine peptidase
VVDRSFPATTGLLLAAVLALGSACATGREWTLTAADRGSEAELRLGDTIRLSLPENPTTGYTWALDDAESTPLAVVSSGYTRGRDAPPGAGGVRTLVLKPGTTGRFQLRLKRWRPWEGDPSIVERFDLTVLVKD